MSAAAAVPALDNTFGCLYLASIITMGLWGAGTVQVYYYFDKYTNDGYLLKTHVFVVWALDTAHQALILHSTYSYLIKNYANILFLEHLTNTLRDSIILTAFICALVQSLFVARIWLCGSSSLVSSSPSSYRRSSTTAKAYRFKDFAGLSTIVVVTRTINVITAVTDATIAAVLVYLLRSSRAGFKKSETIFNKLMAYAINTGLITGVCAIASLITGFALSTTFIYVLFYLMLSRLYMNSMLAALNSRHNLRGGLTDNSEPGSGGISLSNIRDRSDFNTNRDDAGGRTPSESDIEAADPQKPQTY
ncbi:hypothetical protein DFH11DRAFT_1727587 [Phellopilus nigrolimitatus]|nr:hypothetical protein DFH11DRAFT_1727587 [Phellopilus nigrolimitatus]